MQSHVFMYVSKRCTENQEDIFMTIKVITIDFWNTLYDSSGGEQREQERFALITREAARLGTELQLPPIKHAQKAAWEHFTKIWQEEHRTPATRSLVEVFWRELGVHADEQAILSLTTAFCEGVLHHPPSLLPGVADVLASLAGRFSLALISDTAFSPGRILKQVMERDNIAHYFDVFSFSDETGVAKPHPKAFYTALAPLGCEPSESIHIGDIERTDVMGAKNIGMKAILFAGDPNGQMNHDHQHLPSRADVRAESWQEILAHVHRLT